MKLLDILFWVFAAGVGLWIAGIWISMLIPRRERRQAGPAMPAGGGFTGTAAGDSLISFDSSSSDATSESGGGDSGGDFSGGGGESGGGGSSGSW